VISKRVKLQCEEKIGRLPIKLSRKRTTAEEDIELNEELIKICLEVVEKYVTAIHEVEFHLSTLEDRELKYLSSATLEQFAGYRRRVDLEYFLIKNDT
jgi:septum formation topological specificity factor MinE